jgi:hypothetical protein
MNNIIKTTIYRDLAVEFLAFNAWKDPECFIDKTIKGLCVIENEIDADIADELSLNVLDAIFLEMVKERILLSGKKAYAVIAEHSPKPINKLRSYKGLLGKEIKNDNLFLEKEVIIENELTLFIAIIEVDKSNIEYLVNRYFSDSSTCCIIQTGENNCQIFNIQFLEIFPKKYMNIRSVVTIEYSQLCKDLIQYDQIVFRSGGDGDRILSLQAFVSCNIIANIILMK